MRELARHGRPGGVFIPPADDALDLESPLLQVALRKAERLEGHGDLRTPAVLQHFRAGEPGAVPVGIVPPAVFGGLHVALCATGVGVESVAIASIEERVEDEQERVALKVREVAPQGVDDQPARLVVVQHRADVQHLAVVEKAHFAALAGGAELVGKLLIEIDRGLGQRPGGLVERAVDDDWFRDAYRGHAFGRANRFNVKLLRRGRRCRQGQGHGTAHAERTQSHAGQLSTALGARRSAKAARQASAG